jgi:hypothetical protein
MKNLINAPEIKDVKMFDVFETNKISATINNKIYIGEYWKCGEVICVTYLREINSTKQTTLRKLGRL